MDTGQARNRESAATDWLVADGEMGRLIRSKDWSKTPVGPPAGWPQSLKTALGIMLHSRYQMFVWWGKQLTYFYNDAYIPVLGKRHPWALGQSPQKVWPEIWDTIGPQAEIVVNEARATWNDQLELIMERNGYTEETFFTFSYSPIPDDTGRVAGVYCACTEETHRVLGERRLGVLRHLASATADSKSVEDTCEVAARTLEEHGRDVSFALIYFIHRVGGQARLTASCGVAPAGELAPQWVELSEAARPTHFWPFMEALSGHAVIVRGLENQGLPGGPWPEPTNTALVLPLANSGQEQQPTGFLIVGASPRREFEDQYQGFFELVAGSIASAISHARSYEEERSRAEALAEIDRAKTAFFSNVSHEFRTPLTLMLGPLEEILSDRQIPLVPEHRERLEMAHRNSLRLQKLVNTLLDFSRIEAGRIQAAYEPVDLARLTIELASTFRSAVERAGMRLVVDCESVGEPVFVDRDMWEKIVLNLLSNAFKFTLEGEIEVALRRVAQTMQLTVRDTGTGISPEQLPHIFERFHRVEGIRARTHEGTGIGLALVQELVKLHGGTTAVRSVYGVGTTLTVTIPLGWAHLPADRLGDSSALAAASQAGRPYAEEANHWVPESCRETADETQERSALPDGRSRILLADDNADMRDYVRKLLSGRYDVEAVPDGEAALAAIRRQAPDLALIDVMMPKIDGFQLLAALRSEADTRTLPIIMLSARAGEEARIEGLNAGADDYLIKPFSARELQARVAAHLETVRLRKEAEQAVRDSELRFRTMADTAPAMLWVTDSAGECTFLSRGWYEFTGLTEITGLRGAWKDATHPDDREQARSEAMTAASKREPFAIDYRLRRSDGEYRWVIDSARPRSSESGEFLGYIGSIIDITERKQYEVALKDADRRKDEFLATLAHELRNPLAPILNAVDILKTKGPPARELQWSQDVIARQVKHMARLLDDLLDVSRITLDKLELRPERVELETVIHSALESSRPLITQRGQDLKVMLPPHPVYLNADPTRLEQVFLNLLDNAAKYTRQGGQIWLTVEGVPSSRHGEDLVGVSPQTAAPFSAQFQPGESHVVVRVRDSGIGIPAEMLSRIFEMFTQVARSVERSYGGLGLGLTLVKRLVELHGGSVEARSDHSGSEFIVRLPVLDSSSRPEDLLLDAQPKLPLAKPRSRRVLVVDDNPDSVETLSILLQLRRNDVLTAVDGLEAVEAAAAFQPDLILLDIGLPKLNGYDAARRIREQRQDNRVVIVAMTGWGQEEDKRKSKEAGFDQHLVKPVDPGLLEELLASAPILD
jgi:PAS domain S-box-containing protein